MATWNESERKKGVGVQPKSNWPVTKGVKEGNKCYVLSNKKQYLQGYEIIFPIQKIKTKMWPNLLKFSLIACFGRITVNLNLLECITTLSIQA